MFNSKKEVIKNFGKEKMSKDKKEQPKVENKILPKVVTDLQKNTWTEIQEVAKSERVVNVKMLNIAFNFFKMFEKNDLHILEYFDQADQKQFSNLDKMQLVEEIIYDAEKEKDRTLGNAHFEKFANRVIVYSLGKNRETFLKEFSDEYRIIKDVAPVVLFWIVNNDFINYDKNKNPFTKPNDDKTPIRLKINYDYFDQFGSKYEQNRFLQKFYLKGKMGTDYAETFRGEMGVLELAKFSFKSQTERDHETGNSEESHLFKTYSKVAETMKNNQNIQTGTSGVAPKQRANEIIAIETILNQSIMNLLKSKTNEGYTAIFNHYLEMVKIVETNKDLKSWLDRNTKPSNKVEYSPRVNGNKWDITSGNLLKRIGTN